MRFLSGAALAASLVVAAPVVRADTIDMSTVTCEQMESMDADTIAWYLVWLDGWLAGQADETTLDVDQLGAQIDGIAAKCAENPSLSVINAAKAYLNE